MCSSYLAVVLETLPLRVQSGLIGVWMEMMLMVLSVLPIGSMEVEEYVDFRYEFVDGNETEARTTGSSLNTSVKTLTPTLTITQWKYM
jgi:hypothetical protein